MALGDLTSRDAVLRAIAEYDLLGGDAFRSEHGFGPARSYFLVHDGRRYDSKAIAGVAHGYQHPELGALGAADFSGGDATVRPVLERLGFVIVDTAAVAARPLELWQTYTREDVQGIFSPDTPFRPQGGTWGLQGIVAIPERPSSYVFFVTFGRIQGDHAFDEAITADGVLTWQSQPKQRLSDPTIQTFINHDDRTDSIYLFLRTRSGVPYIYCGVLGYLSHDEDREQPVYFQWQLMDWPPPNEILEALHIQPLPAQLPAGPGIAPASGLTEVPPPQVTKRGGRHTRQFVGNKQATHPDHGARNVELGLAGEELVLEMERQKLVAGGRHELAERIVHVALVEGDGAGYDIRSYELDGTLRFIEVKTTRGAATAAFFVSPNEIALSRARAANYVLIRLFGYDGANESASYYQVRGCVEDSFDLTPTEYRASLSPADD